MSKKRQLVSEQKAAADALGITDRQLRNWQQEPGFPDCTAGYDVAAIEAWRDDRGRKGSDESDRERQLRIAEREQAVRIKTAEADRREREEQEAQGNILPRDEYTLFVREVVTVVRDRLLRLPKTLAKLVSGSEAQRKLLEEGEAEVRKFLTALHRELEKGPR